MSNFGIVVDADGLVLREISADRSLAVWSTDRNDALVLDREYAETEIIGHWGAVKHERTYRNL